ncbi:receptor like protein kinase S.2-like [Rutidosis leptorrhynchoides]|uniref:receptor like protein kinase S.2-like n=1 Tax=Rutidosis leptorrhynchoides TaxID=125765 RepID=UPI003A996643
MDWLLAKQPVEMINSNIDQDQSTLDQVFIDLKGSRSTFRRRDLLKNLEHMRIQLKDISLATESFSRKKLISSGGFGTVYRGKLQRVDTGYRYNTEGENECEVAIKRISHPNIEVAQEGFYAEIELLSKCKHSNIIPLLGFCDEDSSMILIYEYALNKSLMDYILNKSGVYNNSWTQRVKICIDVAKGLKFLHTNEGDKSEIVHRDIKSGNILLGKNFDAKIADFGLSTYVSVSEELNTSYYTGCAGTELYLDPQYAEEKKLKTEIDVYSFGVVLFEILCGKLANDPTYKSKNKDGLAGIARQYNDSRRTLMEMVDQKIKEEITETILTSVRGPDKDSVDTFSNIAHLCLKKSQAGRPTMEVVIEELQRALLFQENRKDIFRNSFKTINSVTETFNPHFGTGSDQFWDSYEVKIPHASGSFIHVKRLHTHHHEAEQYFYTEKKILMEYKHENVISLSGYCDEMDEKILVYEHTSSGSLDTHLNDGSLTWAKRLEICIDVASGLEFLHGGGVATHEIVIHRDIKSSNILLDGDMKAKIAGFGFSIIRSVKQEMVFSTDFAAGTKFYIDPEYDRTGLLSKQCDIYSFGVILFEIFFQKLAYSPESKDNNGHLIPMVKDLYKKGKMDDMVFEGTKESIEPQSLIIFKRIAIQCLHDMREERPTAGELVIQLKKALKIQVDGADIITIYQSSRAERTVKLAEKVMIQHVSATALATPRYSASALEREGSKTSHALNVSNDPFERMEVLLSRIKQEETNLLNCM